MLYWLCLCLHHISHDYHVHLLLWHCTDIRPAMSSSHHCFHGTTMYIVTVLCHCCFYTMLPLASLVASSSLTPFHHCCGTVLKQIVTRLDEVPHGEQLDSEGCTISEHY